MRKKREERNRKREIAVPEEKKNISRNPEQSKGKKKEASGFLGIKKILIETATVKSARKGSEWVPGDQEIPHRNPRAPPLKAK